MSEEIESVATDDGAGRAANPVGHQEASTGHQNGVGHAHDSTGYENGVGHQKFHLDEDHPKGGETAEADVPSPDRAPVGHQETSTGHENGVGHDHDSTGYANGVGHQKFHGDEKEATDSADAGVVDDDPVREVAPVGHQEASIGHENGVGHDHDSTGYANGVGHQKFHIEEDDPHDIISALCHLPPLPEDDFGQHDDDDDGFEFDALI